MAKSTLYALCLSLALGGALYQTALHAEEASAEAQAAQIFLPQQDQVSINEASAEQLSCRFEKSPINCELPRAIWRLHGD